MEITELLPGLIEKAVEQYYYDRWCFIRQNPFLLPLKNLEIDHIGLKALDSQMYEDCIALWLPRAHRASYVVLNDRRLATFELEEEVADLTNVLEFMEPRPEKVGRDSYGLDHLEFFVSSLDAVIEIFNQGNLPYTRGGNDYHKTVNIRMKPHSDKEIKYTATRLTDIVNQQHKAGIVTWLKGRPTTG